MPGPPPKADAVRRNSRVGTMKLPAEGRQGPTPEWPLINDVVMTAKRDMALASAESLADQLADEEDSRKRGAIQRKLTAATEQVTILDRQLDAQRDLETALWADLWVTPQAVAWERMGWTREVAQYVRHKVLGELGSMDDAKEARAWSDRLGLNPKAMRALLWEVVADEVAEKRKASTAPSTRRRLKAVD